MKAGDRHNMLTAVREGARTNTKRQRRQWVFKCDCGMEKEIQVIKVLRGDTKSCGCLKVAEETKKKRSESLKENYASGKRKQIDPERLKQISEECSKRMRKQYEDGTRKANYTPDGRPYGFIARKKDELLETNRRIGIDRIGTPNPPGPSAKGPDNMFAKYWQLKGPNQQIIEGWNLNELVRANAHLFSQSDIKWNGSDCRATKGLRTLFRMKNGSPRTHSWKGWTIGDRRDDEPKNEK